MQNEDDVDAFFPTICAIFFLNARGRFPEPAFQFLMLFFQVLEKRGRQKNDRTHST